MQPRKRIKWDFLRTLWNYKLDKPNTRNRNGMQCNATQRNELGDANSLSCEHWTWTYLWKMMMFVAIVSAMIVMLSLIRFSYFQWQWQYHDHPISGFRLRHLICQPQSVRGAPFWTHFWLFCTVHPLHIDSSSIQSIFHSWKKAKVKINRNWDQKNYKGKVK